MDEIEKMQYQNLRYQLNTELVDPILGHDYYNLGYCVYSTDSNTVYDLKRHYIRLENDYTVAKNLLIISLVLNFLQLWR